MPALDIRTLALFSTLITFLVALLMMMPLLRAGDRSLYFRLWTLGFCLRALGFLGIYFRGGIPDFLSMPVANTAIIAGEVMFYLGIRLFSGRPTGWGPGAAIVAATFAILLTLFSQPDYRISVLAISLIALLLDGWIAWNLARRADAPELLFLQRLVASFFLAESAMLLLRSVLIVTGGPIAGVFAPGPVAAIGFIASSIVPVCFGIGFMSLINKRAELEKSRLIARLEESLASNKILSGMLPICACCKKIRDDGGYWQQVEVYLSKHSQAEFSHGICPDCAQKLYPGLRK